MDRHLVVMGDQNAEIFAFLVPREQVPGLEGDIFLRIPGVKGNAGGFPGLGRCRRPGESCGGCGAGTGRLRGGSAGACCRGGRRGDALSVPGGSLGAAIRLSGTVTVVGLSADRRLCISTPPRDKRLRPSRTARTMIAVLIFLFCSNPTHSFMIECLRFKHCVHIASGKIVGIVQPRGCICACFCRVCHSVQEHFPKLHLLYYNNIS